MKRFLLAALLFAAAPALAGEDAVRIGVLEDMSTAMADTFGTGEAVASRMAV